MFVNKGKLLARQVLVRAMHSRLAARNRRRSRPGEIRRVLVIRPDHLGDLLFATPALAFLKQALPGAHITGAVGPWGRAMWEGNPDLDALVTIPFPGIAGHRDGGPFAPYTLLGEAAREIARGKYDLGIVLRFDHWWGAALLWAAGIPYRVGYDTPGMGGWLTHDVEYVSGRHEVGQNLRLVEGALGGIGATRFQTFSPAGKARRINPRATNTNPAYAGWQQTGPASEERIRIGSPRSYAPGGAMSLGVDRAKGEPPLRPPTPNPSPNLEEMLNEWLSAPRHMVMHPGTGAANKLWTIAGWADIISKLRSEGWAVALTGSPSERALANAIAGVEAGYTPPSPAHTAPLLNIAGQTATLSELAWVLEQAHMVLGVDSGPLHIAAALDKPTLHLYGPTDETIWGPWGDPRKHRPFRAPGTRPTGHLDAGSGELEGGPEMWAIAPEMVWAQVQKLMHDSQ